MTSFPDALLTLLSAPCKVVAIHNYAAINTDTCNYYIMLLLQRNGREF